MVSITTTIKKLFFLTSISLLVACNSTTQEQQQSTDIYAALRNDQIQYRSDDEGQEVSQTSPEFIDQKVREIRNLFHRRDYDSCVDAAERLLRIDGNIAEAYYWLARVRIEQGDFQQAYDIAGRGLSTAPAKNMKRELERIKGIAQLGAN